LGLLKKKLGLQQKLKFSEEATKGGDMRALILTTMVFVSGCVNLTPTAMVMGRDSGDMGSGGVKNILFGSSGPIEIKLRGETFTGTWVAVRDGGSTQYSLLNAYANTGATASGSALGISRADAGYGTAMLSSPGGNTLQCEYRYSTVTGTATGVCRHKNGEIFDLQVG
tara:strand:- start:3176 stop:3679 length:504 start_codon:yes stop_codon:yes gene_type:complete